MKNLSTYLISLLFFLGCFTSCAEKVKSDNMTARFSDSGNIETLQLTGDQIQRDFSTGIILEGFQMSHLDQKKIPGGGLQYKKTLADGQREIEMVERFIPTGSSIRWEVEITDQGSNWSTPVQLGIKYPAGPGTKFWTAWSDPRGNIGGDDYDSEAFANGLVNGTAVIDKDWTDPLISVPLRDEIFYYGSPYYEYDNPRTAFCPFQGDIFCIPLMSLLEEKEDMGISLALSPEDLLLDMYMETRQSGEITFTHLNHRLGEGRTLKFSMDIVSHEADWRAALRWISSRYSEFFEPVNSLADSIAGTGAYSRNWMDFDTKKLSKMAFAVNWKASFDFPYMGMFIPPVQDNVDWQSYGGDETSIKRMRKYSKQMRDHGFYVLSYFNVTEFGADINYPPPSVCTDDPQELWKDPNDFLYSELADAILYTPTKQTPFVSVHYGLTEPDKPFWTWGNGIIMDPGEPVYQNFLLEQAHRHVEKIPDASGICIDRMDWLRMYNHRRDDGVSWFGGQPVRSMYVSWMELMEKLAPVFHENNKVIYVNNHIKRLEQLRYVDGIFDEFTYAGSPLNSVAFLGIQKPVLGWIGTADQYKPDPDQAMQKYLYLGVFPMAPFPANDHSLRPGAWIDSLYLDYGPLLQMLKGKKWVLEPHVITVRDKQAKANLFKTFEGYAIPVVFAGDSRKVSVALNGDIFTKGSFEAYVLLPGSEEKVAVKQEVRDGKLLLTTPVNRGCGMVVLQNSFIIQ